MMSRDVARTIVILAFEASALPKAGMRSYPVEVALGVPDSGEIRSWLIMPEREWLEAWDYEAEQIHHLTREHILVHGLPREQVAREVCDMIGAREVLSGRTR